jgi:hypothetical protein
VRLVDPFLDAADAVLDRADSLLVLGNHGVNG